MLFVSLVIFPFVWAIGYLSLKLFAGSDLGPVGNTIKHIFFFIGVIAHELSHRVMCAITGVPTSGMSVTYRDDKTRRVAPQGYVTPRQEYQMSFLQALLVCFAPVLIGAWIIYFLLQVALSSSFDPLFRIIAAFCALSVLLASSPSGSGGDLSFIKFGYQNGPQHSQYQIFLVVISFLITWFIVGVYNIIFPVEFFYYFLLIFFYVLLKYGLISIRLLFNKVQNRNDRIPTKVKRRLIRRRFRPEIDNRYCMDYEDEYEVI
ncbi:MAG: hypothetical protein ACFFFT_00225 [Candidatus Thorarchaeota archaeon]